MISSCDAGIVEQSWLAPDVRLLLLSAPEIARAAQPGQFVHLRPSYANDPLLRRPISICQVDVANGIVTVVYRVVGRGTELLSQARPGIDTINCLGPLGSGFTLDSQKPLLVGGGMGLAPLVYLAQAFCPRPSTIVLGGRSKQELYWVDMFSSVCDSVHITTNDGSLGRQGVTVDVLPELLASGQYDKVYACGPRPMLKGVIDCAKSYGIASEVSLEEHMACGIGACLVCTCDTTGGRKKVCSDGPVFCGEDVVFD